MQKNSHNLIEGVFSFQRTGFVGQGPPPRPKQLSSAQAMANAAMNATAGPSRGLVGNGLKVRQLPQEKLLGQSYKNAASGRACEGLLLGG